MKRIHRQAALGSLLVFVLAGCTYEATIAEDDALIVNRMNGRVYRAYDTVVVELPQIDLESQESGRVLSRATGIAGNRFAVRAEVKLLNTLLLWNLTIEPEVVGSEDDGEQERFNELMQELSELRGLSWTSVTLDLRDADRFLVVPVQIALNDRDVTNVVDEDGETSGFMYEGQLELGYEALRQIETLDLRWRL